MSDMEDKLWKCAMALNALVKQLEKVHADSGYQSVWMNDAIHGGGYKGPKYVDELASAKEALKEINAFD